MKRFDAVKRIAESLPERALTLSCNGMISREFHETGDRPDRFYMIGSMGLASSMGLGLATARPDRTVVVLDGDGNVLMNMGTLASIAAEAPANLYHLVLDNGVHMSTGGQRTITDRVRLEDVAGACGYRRAIRVESTEELERELEHFFDEPGPAMLLCAVEPGNLPGVGRVEVPPDEIAARFRAAATDEETR